MNTQISSIFEGLNPVQKQAVEQFEGPSLIVAGAGSGKTKVLTCRIANILSNGNNAGSILALTFTNKASKEMKVRISALVGPERSRYLWMGTFHSVFVRFLREDAELLGFPKSFTIYDTSDSKSAIRSCIKELCLDEKIYKPNEVLSRISMAKNNLVTSAAYFSNVNLIQNDVASRKPRICDIYALYEKKCKQAGAMDFDDILVYTNILLRDFPQVLDKLRARFSYILVDEYQDTNFSQYLIVKKLSAIHKNICVVGDDAQSIYSFRGARIENILNFKKDYPEAKEFKLEQNYRSTQTIVNAANSLIARNSMQLKKECFSAASVGEKIEVVKAYTDQEEAFLLASSVLSKIYSTKAPYSDFAVLYRTNAQSRAVEEALRKRSLPYKIYGGHSFYERAEVKDIMSYLRLLTNKKDDEAFKRVVNVPPRGIGETTIGRLAAASNSAGLSIWEALHSGDLAVMGIKPATAARLFEFTSLITDMSQKVESANAYDLAMEVFIKSGYMEFLRIDTSVEGQARVDNAEELMNSIKAFVEEGEGDMGTHHVYPGNNPDIVGLEPDEQTEKTALPISIGNPLVMLPNYLENITLMSAVDENNGEEDSNKISLMTAHSAKGLEFPYIYIIGMEENLFPSMNSSSSESELEEERRLFYVAITRAKLTVTLSYAQSRFRWGSHVNYPPSRFLKEIDRKFLDWPDLESDNMQQTGSWERISESKPSRPAWQSGNYRNDGTRIAGQERHSQERRQSTEMNQRSANSSSSSSPSSSSPRILPSIPHKAPDPNFCADPISKLKAGQRVEHDRFGFGLLLNLEGDQLNAKAIVDFEGSGKKTLLLKFAKLRIVED
ncbi:MAG: UvrD-helicase domain-containing protein [Bacteroidales bacterium]|jgi:DNA helicase-2/ATP-dependent DNA helicase PcrA